MSDPKANKQKLTDAERHKRFVETAKTVGASGKIEDFDLAFEKVAHLKPTVRSPAKGR